MQSAATISMALDTGAHGIDWAVPAVGTVSLSEIVSTTPYEKNSSNTTTHDHVLHQFARMVLADHVSDSSAVRNEDTTLETPQTHHVSLHSYPSTDPSSPAFQALVKANEKVDPTIFNKRPRIGQTKLGRIKYMTRQPNVIGTTRHTKHIGDVIDDRHEQYALTYGMMCGILNSAGRHHDTSNQKLLHQDFDRVDKREFPGSAKLKHAFKFKDYSPDVFSRIRTRFAIDNADYMITLCGDFNYIQFLANSKSNQFFFYSYDGRFMIKTVSKDESRFLRQILPQYYQYIMENPDTMLSRFYGMHRVKMHHLRRKMHFIIMANVFDTPLEIHARFDLKGSMVGRQTNLEGLKAREVMKDLDFLESQSHVKLGTEERLKLLNQVKCDVAFLQRMKIMDYSLLIGVHRESVVQEDAYDRLRTLREKRGSEMRSSSIKGFSTSFSSLPSTPLDKSLRLEKFESPRYDQGMLSRILRSISSPKPQSKSFRLSFRAERAYTAPNTPKDDTLPRRQSMSRSSEEKSPKHVDRNSFSSSSESELEKCWPVSSESRSDERFHDGSSLLEATAPRNVNGVAGFDEDGNRCFYFFGIIDILQQYNGKKVAETLLKGIRHDRKQISAVNSAFYGDRFLKFIDKHVFYMETESEVSDGKNTTSESKHF